MRMMLKDVCNFYSGTGFPEIYQGSNAGKYPFYKVGDISANVADGNVYLQHCENYINDDVAKAIHGTIIPSDTVVFAKIGEALKKNRRAITTCNCLVDNNAMGISPRKEIIRTRYFYYYMCKLKMQEYAEATAVPSVRKSKLEQVNIDVPEMSDQEEIEKKLDAITTIIKERQQQLQAFDTLIKARFVEMTQNAETISTRMGDVATYVNGYAFKPSDWESDGLPIIRIQNLNDENAPYNYFSGTLDNKYLVHNGDVLVSWATHLEAYIWNAQDAWVNQHIFRVVFDKLPINKYYFVYSTEEALRQAFKNAHGFKPTMEHIKRSDFENAIIELPPIKVQEQFETFVTQVNKSKAAVQAALDKAQLLFDSLMQQYFG